MRTERPKSWLIAITVLATAGCSGGGGGDVIVLPPAYVAGVWNAIATNPGSAVLTGCTGDFTVFNGLTIATLLAGAATCIYSGPLVVAQNGSSFTFLARNFSCDDGNFGFSSGGGTVSGNSLTAQLDVVSQAFGSTGSDYYSGVVTSPTTISASESHLSASGAIQGSCNISPPLSISVTISSASVALSPAYTPTSDAGGIGVSGAALRRLTAAQN